MNKIELLAPAGNFDCLIAAVQSGADAVYISGKSFGARSYADNFSKKELCDAVDYCHLRNVKVFVTVNTLVADSEFDELVEYLVFLNNIGTDAVIVQDIGVVSVARKIVPNLPIHASTQMSIHNSSGVAFLKELGIERVVLARELSMEEIRAISKDQMSEIEVFAHGALCMCYSGQCLMSSVIGARSGNRGKCAQPCRLPYSVNFGKHKAFYMSLKDLCSLEHIDEFIKNGVSSLKIEGRMKGAAYVAAIVGVYRKYIDNPHEIEKKDIELLNSIFNRGGLTDGYITGKIGETMFAFDKPDNPYHKNENNVIKELLRFENSENRKIGLHCRIVVKEGEKPCISFKYDDVSVEYIYDKEVQRAMKAPLSEELIKAQLSKTGGTPFEIEGFEIELGENAFLTAGDLNALRRNGLEKFKEEYLASFRRTCLLKRNEEKASLKVMDHFGYTCEVTSFEQFKAVCEMPFELFYVPLHIIEKNLTAMEDMKEKIVISLPSIIHEKEFEDICKRTEILLGNGFNGVLIQNLSLVNRFKKARVYGGFRLNVFNSECIRFLSEKNLEAVEISPELTLSQIKHLDKAGLVQAMGYGRIPLMITENCVIKNGGKCDCKSVAFLTDRKGMRFPIVKDGESCRSVVLNCKKTFVAEDISRIKEAGVNLLRLYFTDESFEECQRVSRAYLYGEKYKPEDFTTAHYYKGVMQE